MSCCGISRSWSEASGAIEKPSCWQKPLTKVALLVISLLFAGGAVTAHFAGLGIPGIVGFSVASGGFMTLLIASCICRSIRSTKGSSNEEVVQATSPKPTDDESLRRQAKAQQEAIQADVSSMSDAQLLQAMDPAPLRYAPLALALVLTQSLPPISLSAKDQCILETLLSKIETTFKDLGAQGTTSVAQALEPLFNQVNHDPEKFMTLVSFAIQSSRYALRFTAAVLEKLEWPNEELKKNLLPQLLAVKILTDCISLRSSYIECRNHNGFMTNKLVVVTKKIFGNGDFTQQTFPMPESLMPAIGHAIRMSATRMASDLRDMQNAGSLNQATPIGIRVEIGQDMECRFPASMLTPLLPHLTKIDGLVGLELSDVGVGFGDDAAEALSAVFVANPFLVHVQINIDAMTEERRAAFLEQWGGRYWKTAN